MAAVGILTGVNLWMLLAPPGVAVQVLTLMTIPVMGRYVLLFGVVLNVAVSMIFEEWGAGWVADTLGKWTELWTSRRRTTKGYKLVDGGE